MNRNSIKKIVFILLSLLLFACEQKPNYYYDASIAFTDKDYKTALDYYYRDGTTDSQEVDYCKENIINSAISSTANSSVLENEGLYYYDWGLKEEPSITVKEDYIYVDVYLTYKGEHSIYEPHYIVNYEKKDDNWVEHVLRDSYDGSVDVELSEDSFVDNLAYDGYYDLNIININDIDCFNKKVELTAKKLQGISTETMSINASATFNTKSNSWVTKINYSKLIDVSDQEIQSLNYNYFSIKIPANWTEKIQDQDDNGYPYIHIDYFEGDVIVLTIIDNYIGFNDQQLVEKLDHHCVETGLGLACPYENENSFNSLYQYAIEDSGHAMFIYRYLDNDSTFFDVLKTIEPR